MGASIRSLFENHINARKYMLFTGAELVKLYNSKLLFYLEYKIWGIYDAFKYAFVHLNVACFLCRCNVAMIGLPHKAALGKGSEHFKIS